jgi:hypothetical protein
LVAVVGNADKLEPEQIAATCAKVGVTAEFIVEATAVLVIDTQPVIELLASAYTSVVADTVYVLELLCNKVPPVSAEYQSITSPLPAAAESVTLPLPQRDWLPPLAGADGDALGAALTNAKELTQPVTVFALLTA